MGVSMVVVRAAVLPRDFLQTLVTTTTCDLLLPKFRD